MNSAVEHPKHYRLEGIREVLDVIRYALSEEEYLGFLKGNVIKYMAVAFSALILLKTKVYLSKLLYLGGENHGIYECYC